MLATRRRLKATICAAKTRSLMAAFAFATGFAVAAHAEVTEVKLAEQYGLPYLPLEVVKKYRLIETEAEKSGLGALSVTWAQFGSGAAMNDALLSGRLDFASGGVAPMLTIWDKTRGSIDVKGVASLGSMPMYLNTNSPKVRNIRDFGEQERIALPAVKVSIQAIVLQMAAAKAFGEAHSGKLDAMTVSMKHPDAMAALLSNRTEITAHFGNPPFQELELQRANVHTVLNSYDVLGGPTTLDVLYSTEKFHRENPRVYNTVVAALREAMTIINADRKAAAKVYVVEEHSKLDPGFIQHILSNADFVFTTTPRGIMRYADFMHGIDAIRNKPASWKDLFFEEIHDEAGS